MTQYQEICHIARGSALGQMYCRDANKPAMTAAELLSTYRRFKREVTALFHRYGS